MSSRRRSVHTGTHHHHVKADRPMTDNDTEDKRSYYAHQPTGWETTTVTPMSPGMVSVFSTYAGDTDALHCPAMPVYRARYGSEAER
jgi:hypothetical protein